MNQAQARELPAFSPDDLEELSVLGLSDDQIAELLRRLNRARWHIRPLAPRNEVQSELASIVYALEAAAKAVQKLRSPKSPAQVEALGRYTAARLPWMIADPDRWGAKATEDLVLPLQGALQRAREALTTLPTSQRRRRASAFGPMAVDVSLRTGWGLDPYILGVTPSDYPFRPSISPASRFYAVTAVCYRVLTGAPHEPERAIRAYLRLLKQRRAKGL